MNKGSILSISFFFFEEELFRLALKLALT